KTLEGLKAILDETPCDLIIMNGDLVDGFNLKSTYDKYQAIRIFAELIESYNIPWTFAPGNNDGEMDGSNEDIIAYLMQYNNFIYGNEQGVDGSMQFFIDLKANGKLVHSIAVMDSGARKPKATGNYDFIKDTQINWLLEGINERQVKTSVFFHMPTPAFQTAYDNGDAYDGFAMYNTYPYDDIEKNKLLDDMTADNEFISLISCAHQHSNNMCSFYNGRYYQLSSISGYSASHDDFIIPSCTLTVIDTTAADVRSMYTFEQIEI
ncbi:MAG: metallophosphoesterase, partial [Eubacterium sp.]